MDDKTRKLMLTGVLISVIAAIGIYFGQSFVRNTILEPVSKLEQDKKLQLEKLERLGLDEMKLGVARKNLQSWRALSLPEDTAIAQRLYREWIENLGLQCAFSNLSVEPGGKNEQRGKMLAVAVDVKAETDLAGLSRFMYLFDQAALMHRLTNFNISSSGTQGNPRMEVSFSAEGLSVRGSGVRNELFSRSSLAGDLSESATTMTVVSAKDFPQQPPFNVRVDRELLRVTGIDESEWTVLRGNEGTRVAAHKQSAVVELMPFRWSETPKAFEDYKAFLAASPFAVPLPPKKYAPRMNGLADKSIRPGEEVRMTVRVEDFDPALGSVRYSVKSDVDGLEIHAETGELKWATTEQLAEGKYTATVLATQEHATEPLQAQVNVTVTTPNAAPVIQPLANAVAVIGQPFRQTIVATDDGPADKLSYAIVGSPPSGLVINAATGELNWTPEVTQKPGDYSVEIQVTDQGNEPKQASAKLTLLLKEDDAAMTRLTGSVSKDDVWFAWLRNIASGHEMQLKTGERLTLAEIDAVIIKIEPRSILLEDDLGVWSLALGKTVRERILVKAAEPSAAPVSPSPSALISTPTTTGIPLSPEADDAGEQDDFGDDSDDVEFRVPVPDSSSSFVPVAGGDDLMQEESSAPAASPATPASQPESRVKVGKAQSTAPAGGN